MKNWMKKTVSALAGLALLGSCAALAEGEAEKDYGELYPESLVYEDRWAAGNYILDAVSEDEGFRVCITRYGIDDQTVWEYSPLYNAATGALDAPLFGTKTRETLSETGEAAAYTEEYEDGGAVFTINDEGYLLWQDQKEDEGKDLLFKRIGSFEGKYVCDRTTIEIIWDLEDAYDIRISWADSAFVCHDWLFKGVYMPETGAVEALGMESVTEYDENGEIVSVEDVDPEGCEAVFTFNENHNLVWTGTDTVNTEGMEFEFCDPSMIDG